MLCRFLKLTTLVMACAVLAALSAPAPAQIFVERLRPPYRSQRAGRLSRRSDLSGDGRFPKWRRQKW